MSPKPNNIAVYAGSFDPITLGHLNVIQRGRGLFDRLIVGIGRNIEKGTLFSPEERLDLAKLVTRKMDNVEVYAFSGLAVDFVREVGSTTMLRGIRALTDLASEFTMMLANRQLDEGIETVYLMADEEYAHISSSAIKQITPLADDGRLARFLPREIVAAVREKIQRTT